MNQEPSYFEPMSDFGFHWATAQLLKCKPPTKIKLSHEDSTQTLEEELLQNFFFFKLEKIAIE
jgi:hypothetical protein